jgi:hypothetical protein
MIYTKYFYFITFLSIFVSNSIYEFDYRILYETTIHKDNKKFYKNYYINSNDNSFISTIDTLKKGEKPKFMLRDMNDFFIQLDVEGDVKNPGKVKINKNLTRNFRNAFKYQTKNYDFYPMNDTIINEKKYSRVMLKSSNLKREKRKKIGKEIYIIDVSKNYKPMFIFETSYNIYEERKNFPNGLIVEKHYYDYEGNLVKSDKLKDIEPTNLSIEIIED